MMQVYIKESLLADVPTPTATYSSWVSGSHVPEETVTAPASVLRKGNS